MMTQRPHCRSCMLFRQDKGFGGCLTSSVPVQAESPKMLGDSVQCKIQVAKVDIFISGMSERIVHSALSKCFLGKSRMKDPFALNCNLPLWPNCRKCCLQTLCTLEMYTLVLCIESICNNDSHIAKHCKTLRPLARFLAFRLRALYNKPDR